MASSIFLDTNGWLALLNSAEAMHEHADRMWRQIVRKKHPIVIIDWIIAEAGNGLARSTAKGKLQDALKRILRSSRREVVFIDEELLAKSLEFFVQHQDKSWGPGGLCQFHRDAGSWHHGSVYQRPAFRACRI
jgi:predicted nucleic acid-binding protein